MNKSFGNASIFGAQDPYRFRKQNGTFGMRPRPNAYSRPGTDGWTFIRSDWFLRVAQQAWNAVVEHETKMGHTDIIYRAKQIPSTLRLGSTGFMTCALISPPDSIEGSSWIGWLH